MLPEYIPSPSEGVWHLAGFPIRGYALCIIAGIVAAIWIAERRWKARGGTYGEIQDIAIWAVPFGLVGGRVYSLATDHDRYFGSGKAWWEPLAVWHGGLGIWGAVLLGGLGAWIGTHRKGIHFAALADTVAPALLIAQAIGRWGNWFNQELYGRPTKLPWGLEIDSMHRVPGYETYATYHPTFLYECLWNIAAFGLLLVLERRLRLGYGRTMAAYVMVYTVGRFWIEYLRIDTVEYHFLGLRLNDWTSIVCFLGAAAYLVWSSRRHPGSGPTPYVEGRGAPVADAVADETSATVGESDEASATPTEAESASVAESTTE